MFNEHNLMHKILILQIVDQNYQKRNVNIENCLRTIELYIKF